MVASHDEAYRRIFRHPEVIADFLVSLFSHESWFSQLDLSTLEKIQSFFVTRNLDKRIADNVWKVKRRVTVPTSVSATMPAMGTNTDINTQTPTPPATQETTPAPPAAAQATTPEWQELYIVVLIEFQSSIDKFMSFRLLEYTVLLWDHLQQSHKDNTDENLSTFYYPPVLPLVLYNGLQNWTAPLQLHALMGLAQAHELLRFQPAFEYYVLEEPKANAGAFARFAQAVVMFEQTSNTARNLTRGLSRNPEAMARAHQQWADAVAEMLQIVRASGLREVFNDFVTWAWRVLGPPDIELDEKELDAQWKDQSMTTAREAVLQWYAEIKTDAKAEGKLEGKIEGEVAALQKSLLSLLQVKGLPITEEETAKITACTDPNMLLKWQARIFQANTVAELLAE